MPLFEPFRLSFYNGPMPPPMTFLLPSIPLSPSVDVAMLVGLHPQNMPGAYKLVFLYRQWQCIQVFEATSHGRQWHYTLHLATDARLSLQELQPSTGPRAAPYPAWWQHGAGAPYPSIFETSGESVLIRRDAAHALNVSGGVEQLVPERFLLGILPQATRSPNHAPSRFDLFPSRHFSTITNFGKTRQLSRPASDTVTASLATVGYAGGFIVYQDSCQDRSCHLERRQFCFKPKFRIEKRRA